MDSDGWRWALISFFILLNAFFVAAEYALVGARPSRIAAAARKGSRTAKTALAALDNLHSYIAGIQLGITMAGIGLGAFGEAFVARLLKPLFEGLGLHVVASLIAFLLVTFLLVVFGELIPKYLIIRDAAKATLWLILPLNAVLFILRPLTMLLQFSGFVVLKLFGIDIRTQQRPIVAKEELAALIRESQSAGEFDEAHAKVVLKALRLKDLKAGDVMIPRVDIVAVSAESSRDELLDVLSSQSHTRLVAVRKGDIDDVVGILHLQDAMRFLSKKAQSLNDVIRPAVFVPPNLSLAKLIEIMKNQATQMLIVRDEHGGTAGLITLEDIVEEILGEFDDQVERAQPRIERRPDGRIVMKGDVRTDELVEYLGLEENPLGIEPISTIILESLDRTPHLGDTVDTQLGRLRVDNMARSRITRVSLIPNPSLNLGDIKRAE